MKLTHLLMARMLQTRAFASVSMVGILSLRFQLRRERGLNRSLRYYISDSFHFFREPISAALAGNVSTLAMPGSAGNYRNIGLSRLSRLVPTCSCLATVIMSRGEANSSVGPSRFGHVWRQTALSYPSADTLMGRRSRRLQETSADPPKLQDWAWVSRTERGKNWYDDDLRYARQGESHALEVACIDVCDIADGDSVVTGISAAADPSHRVLWPFFAVK